MDLNLHCAAIELPHGRHIALSEAAGARVLCLAGELWITQDGDRADYFIKAGESFPVAVQGSVVVYAQRAARLRVREPRARGWPGLGWLRAWLGPARIDARPPQLAALHGA